MIIRFQDCQGHSDESVQDGAPYDLIRKSEPGREKFRGPVEEG